MAGDLELEAMCTDDCSWHPCQVNLSPNGAGLVVRYENNDSEDILVSGKEALMRLRVRSLPFQNDDCTRIKQGEHVVVNTNSESESRFLDAEVEKVVRVRHSKRMPCRCTFVIKWLHQDRNEGSLTVPSTSIKRLANESINDHPTISAFTEAVPLSNSSFSSMSPLPDVVNDIDLELQELLEKQIAGIHNSVNGTKKKTRDDSLGIEGTNEQVEDRKIPTALPENRSPLNPLAARAALASLMMSKFSNDKEGKRFADFSGASPEPIGTVKPPFSASSPSDVSRVSEPSNRSGKRHKKAHGTVFGTQPREAKAGPERKTRPTRAAVGIERTAACAVDNSPSTTVSRRLTRSVLLRKEEELETAAVVETPVSRKRKVKAEGNEKTAAIISLTGVESETMELGNEESGIGGNSCCVVAKNRSNTRRLTRSSATKKSAKTEMETMQESGGDELPIDASAEQRNKKKKTSRVAITTQDAGEDVVVVAAAAGDGGRGSRRKSKGHEVRVPPKTRSRSKA